MNARSSESLRHRSTKSPGPRLAVVAVGLALVFAASAKSHSGGRAKAPASYAEVDEALEGVVLLESDALWRYFVGTEDPAPKFTWGKPRFDDSSWLEGPAPFGFGGDEPVGTTIEEIGEGVSTVYYRRVLEIPDRSLYERILLEVPIDDGYVLFVRGNEEDRLHAVKYDEVIPFDGHASTERSLDTPPVPVVDLTPTIKDVRTQLAFQTLTHKDDPGVYGFRPRIWARYAVTPEGETTRLESLRPLLEGEDSAPLRAYLEGRHLQRLGDAAGALSHFQSAAELDPKSTEPWQRLVECHRATGRLEELDAFMKEGVEGGAGTPAMLDAWAGLHLDDLGRPATDLPRLLPPDDSYPTHGLFADALWAGATLAAGHALRIDCGAQEDTASVGNGDAGWSRDRCHHVGLATALSNGSAEGGIGATVRSCKRNLSELLPVYRIPAVQGLYELRLTFEGRATGEAKSDEVTPGEATLDVMVEGMRAVRSFDPVTAAGNGLAVVTLPVHLRDTVLELDLLPQSTFLPRIAAIELVPIEGERFGELAAARVNATGRMSAFALAQLAEARLQGDDARGAFALLEEAELLPDFHASQSARLSEVRDGLLPRLLSFATADDLVERRGAEAREILSAVQAKGEDPINATYFEGRIELAAGRIDDAIGAFETLVGDGSEVADAWLGMALCLADSALEAEAAGLIEEALTMGVAPTPALLQAWISLELGLGTDPWNLLAKLREHDVPDDLWVVPTSEGAPLTWRYTPIEPPANAWSRQTYDDAHWSVGPAGFGSGHTVAGTARTFWNSEKVFARYHFDLRGGRLLYAHADVHANDAADVYMNGTRVCRVSVATNGYVRMPLAKPNVGAGDNVIGVFGYNVKDDSGADAGLVQPIADLAWIADELADDGFIRLNCGGGELTTSDGRLWSADRMYGWAKASAAADPDLDVLGTEDDALFRTHRWFYKDSPSAWYQIPAPNGSYRITLYFAEVDPAKAEAGVRTFDVRIETVLVLDDLDVAGSAGFATLATHSFDTEVTDGYLDILVNDEKKRSFLSALEIQKTD